MFRTDAKTHNLKAQLQYLNSEMAPNARLSLLQTFNDSTENYSLAERLAVLHWLKQKAVATKQDALKDNEKQILILLENRIAARKELKAAGAELPDTDEFTDNVAALLDVQATPKSPVKQQTYVSLAEAAVAYHDRAEPEAFKEDVRFRYHEADVYILQAAVPADGSISPSEHVKYLTFLPEDVTKIELWQHDRDIGYLHVEFRGSLLSFVHLYFKKDPDPYKVAKDLEARTGLKTKVYEFEDENWELVQTGLRTEAENL